MTFITHKAGRLFYSTFTIEIDSRFGRKDDLEENEA